jgi:uncharacterized protein YcbK (DUF882 family)
MWFACLLNLKDNITPRRIPSDDDNVVAGDNMIRCHRRDFLKLGTLALVSSLFPIPVLAAVSKDSANAERTLAFYNTHTAEFARVCYFRDSAYQPEALKKINHVLRDHRANKIKTIDPGLLDVLHSIQGRLAATGPFHVISGYRSPETNEMLRHASSGVARKSMHTQGKAIDIRLPGCNTKHLSKVCMELKAGGVGYYAKSDFVHVDTGRVRTW